MSCPLLHSGTTQENIQPALWLFHLVLIPGIELCFGHSSAAFRTLNLTYTQGQASPMCGSCSSSTSEDLGKRYLSPLTQLMCLNPINYRHETGKESSYLSKWCFCSRTFGISNTSIPRSKAPCCSDQQRRGDHTRHCSRLKTAHTKYDTSCPQFLNSSEQPRAQLFRQRKKYLSCHRFEYVLPALLFEPPRALILLPIEEGWNFVPEVPGFFK